jgi:hypothetical protein
VLCDSILGPLFAQLPGPQVDNAIAHAKQPRVSVPAVTGISEQRLGDFESCINPEPVFAVECPLDFALALLSVGKAGCSASASAGRCDGKSAHFVRLVLTPAAAAFIPDEPAALRVIVPQRIAEEKRQVFRVPRVSSWKLGGLFPR